MKFYISNCEKVILINPRLNDNSFWISDNSISPDFMGRREGFISIIRNIPSNFSRINNGVIKIKSSDKRKIYIAKSQLDKESIHILFSTFNGFRILNLNENTLKPLPKYHFKYQEFQGWVEIKELSIIIDDKSISSLKFKIEDHSLLNNKDIISIRQRLFS